MRKRLGAKDRVGTDYELPWDSTIHGDLSGFDGAAAGKNYVYSWHILFPNAKAILEENLALLNASKEPVVPPVAAHDMAHCVNALFAGSTTKDGNNNLLQIALSMFSKESERWFTWEKHAAFLKKHLGDAINNRHSTGIMDENTSGMRALAMYLSSVELMRCAEHRSNTVSKGGIRGDKWIYQRFAKAKTIVHQDLILAECSSTMRVKINKVTYCEQLLASKTRPGYGETMGNAIESTWAMLYSARRANLARALLVVARHFFERLTRLKMVAKDLPVNQKLTPHASKRLAEFKTDGLLLTSFDAIDDV